MSRVMRKPVFGVSDRVRHKHAVQQKARGLNIRDIACCTIHEAKVKALISCTDLMRGSMNFSRGSGGGGGGSSFRSW